MWYCKDTMMSEELYVVLLRQEDVGRATIWRCKYTKVSQAPLYGTIMARGFHYRHYVVL